MFLGIKMTRAAALTLKAHGLPQGRAVCVPADLWNDYVLGETPVERSCYIMQLLADLRDYVSKETGEWAFGEITEVAMKWGLVESLRSCGRKVQDAEHIISWLNERIREQAPPEVAVSTDGSRMRILLGDNVVPGIRLQHHETTGQKFYDRYHAEKEHADRVGAPPDTPAWGSDAHYALMREWETGSREIVWKQ